MRNLLLYLSGLFFLLGIPVSTMQAQNPNFLKDKQAVVTFAADPTTPGLPVAAIYDVVKSYEAIPGTNWYDGNHPNQLGRYIPANWTVGNLGEVFGIAIDANTGTIFLAATDIYGWPTATGVAGRAGIYKAVGPAYLAVPLVTTDVAACGTPIGVSRIANSGGAGNSIGNIAFDQWHNQLFATNKEDGKIYRINPVTGQTLSAYDPFTADGCLPGLVNSTEQLGGIGVFKDASGVTRVYFARAQGTAGNCEIWSVQLTATGEYTGTQAASIYSGSPSELKEFEVRNALITDIEFSSVGNMLLAERNGAHSSQLYEVIGTTSAWGAPKLLHVGADIGAINIGTNCAGGADYGPKAKDIDVFECDSLIWSSGNYLMAGNNNLPPILGPNCCVYGLEGIPASGNSILTNNLTDIYVDYDVSYGTQTKGSMGDVDICRKSCDDPGICDKVSFQFKKVAPDSSGNCCWNVSINNEYAPGYFSGLQFDALGSTQIAISSTAPGWGIDYHIPSTAIISPSPTAFIALGVQIDIAKICLANYTGSGGLVEFSWLGPPQPSNNDSVAKLCTTRVPFDCAPAQDPRCAILNDLSTSCKDGKVKFTFDVKNNSPFVFKSLILSPSQPNVNVTPPVLVLSPAILPGQTGGPYSVTLTGSGVQAGDTLCFYLTAHDSPLNNVPPTNCCTDSVNLVCIVIPDCDPCDGVSHSVTSTQQGQKTCCYTLSVTNAYDGHFFSGLQLEGINGVQIEYASGWDIVPPIQSSLINLQYPGGDPVPLGTFPNFATFCLNGFTTSPQQVVLHWIGLDGVRVCSDTILFDCDPPPPPTCVSAVKDSIWCDGAQIKYTFSVANAALNTFPVKSIVLSSSNPNITASQTYFVFTPAILPGQTSGSITVNIGGSAAIPDSLWCFYLTAHNNIIDTTNHMYPTICCTDSVQVHCLTIPDCAANKDSCCNANDVAMPTGFSPNNDNINDIFEIRGISKCKQINLTVFNRWGNIVYQQVNYSNTWDGTNQNGNPLPQGTYYIMVDLIDSGSTVSGFVDLRRY